MKIQFAVSALRSNSIYFFFSSCRLLFGLLSSSPVASFVLLKRGESLPKTRKQGNTVYVLYSTVGMFGGRIRKGGLRAQLD